MTSEEIAGIARHVLTTLGGYFVARGVVDDSTLTTVVAAIVTVGGALWSVWAKKKAAAKLADK